MLNYLWLGNIEDFNNEIEDATKAMLIEDCVDEGMIDYFSQINLPITYFEEFCNDPEIEEAIECDNCSPQQLQINTTAHNEAIRMLNCSITALES